MSSDPRIPLKKPWLAGLLAFLVPGAGHLYQGRCFKAGIYFTCILGLYLLGMILSGWQALQVPSDEALKNSRVFSLLKYGAQAGVGSPALFGLLQRERYSSNANVPPDSVSKPFSASFEGIASFQDDTGNHTGRVSGTMFLEPAQEQFGKQSITGRFEGTLSDQPVKFRLSNHVQISRPIEGSQRRALSSGIISEVNGNHSDLGHVSGTIPRSFLNWFAVPRSEAEEQNLHDQLGKYYELALVFTWVAGLLNILAIWDAVEGPAYGYGRDPRHPAPTPDADPTPT
ncbi:MAG TPA: DUF6677 family protein [Planctomicrobium sp.]|nr:DUF6677 family protein [Planctomicrobium sp.]